MCQGKFPGGPEASSGGNRNRNVAGTERGISNRPVEDSILCLNYILKVNENGTAKCLPV